MFKGLGTALITPFQLNGDVDYVGLENLVNHQLKEGADTLVVMGTTGEAATLTSDEKRRILDEVININDGKAQIVYGIGGNHTAQVIKDLKTFNTDGVQGILSVSPYYNKPTQDGICAHFTAINDNTPLPVIVYNVPGRTASNMTSETILKLAELDNLCAVKEASGDMEQIMQIIQYKPTDFTLLSGDDALTLPILAAGGDGVISVLSNAYCQEFFNMIVHAKNNRYQEARHEHYKVFTMIDLLFKEGNPAGVKEACKLLGICNNYLRLPLVNASSTLVEAIISNHKMIRP